MAKFPATLTFTKQTIGWHWHVRTFFTHCTIERDGWSLTKKGAIKKAKRKTHPPVKVRGTFQIQLGGDKNE